MKNDEEWNHKKKIFCLLQNSVICNDNIINMRNEDVKLFNPKEIVQNKWRMNSSKKDLTLVAKFGHKGDWLYYEKGKKGICIGRNLLKQFVTKNYLITKMIFKWQNFLTVDLNALFVTSFHFYRNLDILRL